MKRRRKKTWSRLKKRRKVASARRKVSRRISYTNPKFPKALKRMVKTRVGQKLLRRTKKFWKIPHPASVGWMDDTGLKQFKLGGLMSLGKVSQVVLKPKGSARTTRLRGSWEPFSDAAGKRILVLGSRKVQLPWRLVGTATETWYTPTPALEKLGTHKANTMWRHQHTEDGGTPPAIYADRGGKVDRNSNFVYGRGTYSVTDWIRK